MSKKKLLDSSGNIVPGLYRNPDGSINVDDVDSFNKYNRAASFQKKQKETIEEMQRDLEELKKSLQTILANQ